MHSLPRLALAMPATGSEPSTAALAWLAGLTARNWRVQHFRSRACPTATEAVGQVGGLPGRHLDAWAEDLVRHARARYVIVVDWPPLSRLQVAAYQAFRRAPP